MNDRFRISRRTLLRGLGTAVALPAMEAMLPTHLFAAPNAKLEAAATPPLRMAFLCVPNGMHMPDWTPSGEGSEFELPSILEPVSEFKSEMLILSGLTLNGGRALGDGPGDHARSCASFLTSAHPKKTNGADISNGVSIDQAIAEADPKTNNSPPSGLLTRACAQTCRQLSADGGLRKTGDIITCDSRPAALKAMPASSMAVKNIRFM